MHENGHYRIDKEYINQIMNLRSRFNIPIRVHVYAKHIVEIQPAVELLYCLDSREIKVTAENIDDIVKLIV
jgi:hypothetical protein